jgi:hypothetical protein
MPGEETQENGSAWLARSTVLLDGMACLDVGFGGPVHALVLAFKDPVVVGRWVRRRRHGDGAEGGYPSETKNP